MLAMGIAGCTTVQVDTAASRPQLAAQLGVAPEQVVFARHVNYALIPHYATWPLQKGELPANFRSAVLVLTRDSIVLLPPPAASATPASRTQPILMVQRSAVSGVAIQNMTTTLTRAHLQQLQVEFRSNLLALTCADGTDHIGGNPTDTQAAYDQFVGVGLPSGEPHPWVIQQLNVPIPLTVPGG